ncbi:MAG: thioredoxin domain-containing protein [Deltaproteobacteria bacterium]|nr:thioredoxin domain-containing protein [Deltaproteobacteria bacterium]
MSKKMLKWVIPALVILVGLGVFGYLKLYTWNPERQKLAVINDRVITVAQFNRELDKIPAPYQDMLREDPKQLLEQLTMKEIMLQEAKRLGLKSDAPVLTPEAEAALLNNLLQKEVLDKVKVTPEEVDELMRQHKGQVDKKAIKEMTALAENLIREAKGNEKIEEYVASLKNKSKVEIQESRLQEIARPPASTHTVEDFQKAIKSGKPVLVDFGSNSCIPCRQIRPILKELGQEYSGKAQILVVDVYKYKDLAKEFRVQMIPTLIFFDSSGKEVFRHMGAWDKASIVGKLKEAGAA